MAGSNEELLELVSLSEAAALLGVRDDRTVRRHLERHGIPLVRIGRRVRVEPRALALLIEKSRTPRAHQTVPKTKNLRHRQRPAQGAPMARKPKSGATTGGGRQWVEEGLWRWHRKACNASLEPGVPSRCDCRFYCQRQDEFGVWNIRPMDATTLKAARKEKKRRQSEDVLIGLAELPRDLTASEYFEVFIEESDHCEATKRNYRSRWKNDIEPLLGQYRMSEITRRHINAAVKKLAEKAEKRRTKLKRPNPSFVECRLTTMKSMFSHAHATGYIPTNPTAKKKPPKCDPRRPGELPADDPRRILNETQFQALVRWAEQAVAVGGLTARKAIGILFGLFLGLRISEAVAVLWSDIDFEQRTIHVCRQWSAEEKKLISLKGTKKERHLPIPRRLLILLHLLRDEEAQRASFDRDDFVVYRIDPRQPMRQGYLRQAFSDVQALLGIVCEDGFRLVFHGLRHTCATLSIRRGTPLIKVSEFLGHESTKVTQQVYVHLFAGDLVEVADGLDEVAAGGATEENPVSSVDELLDDVLADENPAAA